MVFMPNITTNHAITYTSTPVIVSGFYFFFQFLQYHVIGDSKPLVSFSNLLLKFWLLTVYIKVISYWHNIL